MAKMNDEQVLTEVLYVPREKSKSGTFSFQATNKGGVNWFLYFSAVIVNLITFAIGISFSWASPVLPKLNDLDPEINPLGRQITPSEQSWITGIMALGATAGPLCSGKLADIFGRKKTLLLLAIPITTSYVMIAFATNVYLYYIARFLMGISVGGVFSVMPMYLAEISETHNRGTISCMLGIFVNLSVLYVYFLGPYVSIKWFSLITIGPIIVYVLVFILIVPESPLYLASKSQIDRAEDALRKLRRNESEVVKELKEIMKGIEEGRESDNGGIMDLFTSPDLRRRLIISLGLLFLQQFSGVGAVLAYMQLIFSASGGFIPAHIASMIVGFLKVGGIVFTSLVVERFGRRTLLMISNMGCAVFIIILGIFFYFKNNGYDMENFVWAPVVTLCLYIVFFNLGLGNLPWTVLGELFPPNAKTSACTIASSVNFISNFMVTLFFPILSAYFGMSVSFCLFGFISVCGTVFVYFMLPETKGKSLYEIQHIFNKHVDI